MIIHYRTPMSYVTACGKEVRNRSLKATTDKSKVTCRSCKNAMSKKWKG